MSTRFHVICIVIMLITMACQTAAKTTGGNENNKGVGGGKEGPICKLVPKNQDGVQKCVIKNGKQFCRMTLSRRLIKWCKIKIHN